ncbi:OprD family outer membrane porin, partial [Pseudomonas protegens]
MKQLVLCLLAMSASSPLLAQDNPRPSQQAQAPGFIEGSSLDLNLRHYYSNQHTQRDTYLTIKKPDGNQRTRVRETWVQTGMLKYSSGYTQGLIGIGVDAGLFSAVNLERGHGRVANGGDRVLVDSDGDALPTWSRLGIGDVRLRLSNT